MGKSLSFGGVGASCTLDKVLKSVPLHGKAESLARRSRWQGGVAGKAESLARRSRIRGCLFVPIDPPRQGVKNAGHPQIIAALKTILSPSKIG